MSCEGGRRRRVGRRKRYLRGYAFEEPVAEPLTEGGGRDRPTARSFHSTAVGTVTSIPEPDAGTGHLSALRAVRSATAPSPGLLAAWRAA
jgi:hypothetical protein